MDVKPGQRLASTVCGGRFVLVAAGGGQHDLRCGGQPLVPLGDEPASPSGKPDPDHAGGTQVGKRYTNADGKVELICTQAGEGSLTCDGEEMSLKAAKPLPAAD